MRENDMLEKEEIFSKVLRAGRRTYFFDVRATRGNDYYLTITESRKRFNDNGYDRHKIFLYKEDFNKFIKALTEAVDYVKTDLMPDFDFDAYNHDQVVEGEIEADITTPAPSITTVNTPTNGVPTIASSASSGEEVDKW